MEWLMTYLRRAASLPQLFLRDALGPPRPVIILKPKNELGELTVADPERPSLVTATFDPEYLTVGSVVVPLNPPALATHATVHVIQGEVKRLIIGPGGVPVQGYMVPLASPGYDEICGVELTAYRLVSASTLEAKVVIEYRTES